MAEHGTTARYIAGCRCQDCREANRVYKADWRARGGSVSANRTARRQSREYRAGWAWLRANRPDIAAEISAQARAAEQVSP